MFGDDFQEQISWLWRAGLAQFVMLVLLIFSHISLAFPYIAEVRPFFVLMAIYFWAIHRPTLVPPVMAFVWGVGLDLLANMPLGMNALAFVTVQWMVSRQRVFLMGQPFMMIWLGMGFTAAMYASYQFLIYMVMSGWAPLPTDSLLGSTVFTFVAFPPIAMILVGIHRLLPH